MRKDFAKINEEILVCTKCPLAKSRTNAVPGAGNIRAKIFLLGEAPGQEEDLQKMPFVGRSGKILDRLLLGRRLKRQDLYITNTVKCRPPKNRPPKQSEINTCKPYLLRQLNIIRPKLIITLGTYATKEIFKLFDLPCQNLSKIHGKPYFASFFGKMKIIALYHPSAALRSPKILKKLIKDFSSIKY